MENILEVIVPLVFAAIYFFGNVLSKKGDGAEEDSPGRPVRRSASPEEEAAEARQREIQEAIRRKIMERRGNPAEKASAPIEGVPERAAPASSRLPKEPLPREVPIEREASTAPPENTYEQQMEAHQRRIEATRREAEALRAKALQAEAPKALQAEAPKALQGMSQGKSARSTGSFSGPLRNSLRNASAARAALIYAEVLGPPLALGGRSRMISER